MEAAPANFRIKDYPYFVSLLFLRTSTFKHASLTFSSSKCCRDSINELDWCHADERELVYRRRCVPILQDIRPFGWRRMSLICARRVEVHHWEGQVVIYSVRRNCIAKVGNSWHSLVCFELEDLLWNEQHLLGSFSKFRSSFRIRVIPDKLIGFPNSILNIYVNAFVHMVLVSIQNSTQCMKQFEWNIFHCQILVWRMMNLLLNSTRWMKQFESLRICQNREQKFMDEICLLKPY